MPLWIWNERGGSGHAETVVVKTVMLLFDLDIFIFPHCGLSIMSFLKIELYR